MRRRSVYFAFAILIFAVEILIATRLRKLSFVRGSLGDVLVVMLIYCAALSLREFRRVRLAVGVFLFACAIEGAQYLHLARVLGLRPGGVLGVALGATFQWADIFCYLVGCSTVLSLDLLITRHRGRESFLQPPELRCRQVHKQQEVRQNPDLRAGRDE